MNLFVYGTLLIPKIWEIVSGIDYAGGKEGSISGYGIFRVQEADYPGILLTEKKEEEVGGKVFCDLPDQAIQRLDAYEDDFYERREVAVTLADGTVISAHAYVVPEESAPTILTSSPWTLDWFEEHALERYWNRLFES